MNVDTMAGREKTTLLFIGFTISEKAKSALRTRVTWCSPLADVTTQSNQKSSLKRQEWSGGCPLIILLKDMKCCFRQAYDDRSEEKPDEAKIGEASKRSKKEHDEWQVNPCAH